MNNTSKIVAALVERASYPDEASYKTQSVKVDKPNAKQQKEAKDLAARKKQYAKDLAAYKSLSAQLKGLTNKFKAERDTMEYKAKSAMENKIWRTAEKLERLGENIHNDDHDE